VTPPAATQDPGTAAEETRRAYLQYERQTEFDSRLLTHAARRIRCYAWREIVVKKKRNIILLPRLLAKTIECDIKTARAGIGELVEIGWLIVLKGGGKSGRPRLVTLGWGSESDLRGVAERLRSKRWIPPPPGKRSDVGEQPGTHPGPPLGSPHGRVDHTQKPANLQEPIAVTTATPAPSDHLVIGSSAHQEKRYTAPPLKSSDGALSVYFTEQPKGTQTRDCQTLLEYSVALRLEQGFVQELANTFYVSGLLPLFRSVHDRAWAARNDPERRVCSPGALIRRTLQFRVSCGEMDVLYGPRSAAEKYDFDYRDLHG
jgi:hypothetical protein